MAQTTKSWDEIRETISAAILVGRSTRMGRDKALLQLDQQTFLGHLAEELSVCHEVFISQTLNNDYSGYGLTVIPDEHLGIGPIEGIRQSLRHASCDYVFICGVDLPCVRKEMIRYLAGFLSPEYDICVFRDEDRIHPLCGIYSKAALPAVERMIAEQRYRMRDLLSSVRTQYISIEGSCFSSESFCNINTPEEYRDLLLRSSKG